LGKSLENTGDLLARTIALDTKDSHCEALVGPSSDDVLITELVTEPRTQAAQNDITDSISLFRTHDLELIHRDECQRERLFLTSGEAKVTIQGTLCRNPIPRSCQRIDFTRLLRKAPTVQMVLQPCRQ